MPKSVAIALLWPLLAWAGTVHVGPGQPHATIQDGIDAAAAGDRVVVHAGDYASFEITRPVEVVGIDGADRTTVAAQGAPAARIDVGPALLRGLTLDGAGVQRGLVVDTASVTLEDVVVTRGVTDGDGGGAWVAGSTLTVRRSAFLDNAAALVGGGLMAADSDVTLHGVTFARNTSPSAGGGLYGLRIVGLVAGGHFLDNEVVDQTDAGALGGAMYVRDSSLVVVGTSFTGNAARSPVPDSGLGGALRLYFTESLILGSQFGSNTSTARGGAVAAWGGSLDLYGVLLTGNVVDDPSLDWLHGGTVMCSYTDRCAIERAWFEGNVAGDGGALVSVGTTDFSLTGSMICANEALGDGGAVDLADQPTGLLENNVFTSNVAGGDGGGLVVNAGTLVVRNNHLVGNLAQRGAALYALGDGLGSAPTSTNNLVWRNEAATGHAFATNLTPIVHSWDLLTANTPSDTDGTLGNGAVLGIDPQLVGDEPSCIGADLMPAPGSPLVDGGDPDRLDADASRSDIGAFGGGLARPEDFLDLDGDGWPGMVDCDDADPLAYPGALERCDDRDSDCDGLPDDDDPDAVGSAWYFPDADGDGQGDPSGGRYACPADGWVANGTDCDDTDPDTYAGAPDPLGDGIDQDCDGADGPHDADGDGLPDGLEIALRTDRYHADSDGDGIPDGQERLADSDGDGVIDPLDDDDDGDGIPTAVEGDVDTDGDGLPDYLDLDSDGDGVPDLLEGLEDRDGNGIPDYIDRPSRAEGAPTPPDLGFGLGCRTAPSGPAPWLLLALGLRIRRRSATPTPPEDRQMR